MISVGAAVALVERLRAGRTPRRCSGVLVNCSGVQAGERDLAARRRRCSSRSRRPSCSAASVRSSEAPSGSFTPRDQVQLVLVGMKPRGTALEHQRRSPTSSTAYTREHARRACPACATPRPGSARELRLKKRLNGRNTQPNSRSIRRDGASFGAPCGLQQHGGQRRRQRQRVDRRDHRRDRDGHRELLVELAGDAGQERHRHEHRAQHQRDRDDRARTPPSSPGARPRSGVRPSSMLRSTFSTTTIASSTTMPIASTSPNRSAC